MEKPSLGALFYTYLEVRYIRVAKIRKNGHPDTETLGVYTQIYTYLSAIISLKNDVFCLFVISLKQHKFFCDI